MKKLFTLLSLLMALAACLCFADRASANCEQAYNDLLNKFHNFILSSGSDIDGPLEGAIGVMEAIGGKEKGEALANVGYAILDLNGDEKPELLIGGISESNASGHYGNEIYALYGCGDASPVLIFSGVTRSNYRFIGNGNFFYRGSSGAMHSLFGIYYIAPDGSLACKDCYFTFEKGNNPNDIGFFHNTTGVWSKVEAEELNISEEKFWQLMDEMEKQITLVKLTPFAEYNPSAGAVQTANPVSGASALPAAGAGETDDSSEANNAGAAEMNAAAEAPNAENNAEGTDASEQPLATNEENNTSPAAPAVQVVWAKDALAGNSLDYDSFIADNTPDSVMLLLCAARKVTDFKVLKLEFRDYGGSIRFATEELYRLNSLAPERPLLLGMTFLGSIPAYGISYVDENGTTKYFAIEQSGMDGSLLLTEIEVER